MALLRRQQLTVSVCLCLLLLLLAVTSPAPMVDAAGECYWTAMHVPRWCRAEFIRALFNNDYDGIRGKCCMKLSCICDTACFPVLIHYCDYGRWMPYCSRLPPLRTSNSSKPLPPPPPGRHH